MTNEINSLAGKPTIDSREIAKMMQMEHYKILEKLEGTKDGKTKGIISILNAHDFVVVDYFIKSTYKDLKGEERPCYLFTKLGCEFIANKFTGEKGILFTAAYVKKFNEMEQGIDKNKFGELSPMLQTLINLELRQKEQDTKINAIENRVESIKNVVALNPNDWRRETTDLIIKMAKNVGGNTYIKTIREESYKLLNERFGVSLAVRLTNKRRKMAEEGVCKSKRDKVNHLDVIAEDKKLIEGYVAIIKEMSVKYGVC